MNPQEVTDTAPGLGPAKSEATVDVWSLVRGDHNVRDSYGVDDSSLFP
jgi:hypothetical protein